MKNCKICNAPNTDDAKFCEQCGASFEQNDFQEEAVKAESAIQPQEDVIQQEAVVQTEENTTAETAVSETQTEENGSSEAQSYTQIDLNGVSEEEFSAFVGKNQNDFIPDFRKFCNGKKLSFSPLVFLLSWLVSPLAGAFWFFHRKMNKIGSAVLAIGLALTIASGVAAAFMVNDIADATGKFVRENTSGSYSISPNAKYDYNGDADDFFEDYFDDNNQYFDYDDDYNNNLIGEDVYAREVVQSIMKYLPIIALIGLLNIAFAFVLGFFAKYWYFKFSADSILAIKKNNPTPTYMNDVVAAGGTKCTVWVICLVALIALIFISVIVLAYHLFMSVYRGGYIDFNNIR